MSDHADIAAETVEACLADSERRYRGRSGPESHPAFDGLHCVEEDCGVEIPTVRLNMGKVRCVDCQALLEARQRRAQTNIRVQ